MLQWARLQVAQALLPVRLCERDRGASTLQTRYRTVVCSKVLIAVVATLLRHDRHPIRQQISLANNPLHPRLSVLALFPPMTREIQDQQPTVGRQSVESKARSGPVHHASMLERKLHPGEEKANRNIRFTEIELCIRKQATKQFSNRNKNAFFALLEGPGIGEKRS